MPKALVLLKLLFGRDEPAETQPAHPLRTHFEEIAQYGFGPEVMKTVKVCEICGGQSDSKESRCAGCGARLPEKNLYDLYRIGHRQCECCGTIIPNDGDFCPNCGYGYAAAQWRQTVGITDKQATTNYTYN